MSEKEPMDDLLTALNASLAEGILIAEIRTLAIEWYGKHLSAERFAARTYDLLLQHVKNRLKEPQ